MTLYRGEYRIESARLQGWDYRARGWYLVTICTHNRTHLFGEVVDGQVTFSGLGRIADSELRNLHSHYTHVAIDASVVMPNHVHALVAIDGAHCFSPSASPRDLAIPANREIACPLAGSLSAIIRSYKAGVTRTGRELGWQRNVWQPRFHDHILRGDPAIAAARDYIRNNPANWPQDAENNS
jgi:REP element-mobilizing transposase RayT